MDIELLESICRRLLDSSRARSIVLFDEGNIPIVAVGERASADLALIEAECFAYEGARGRLAEEGSFTSLDKQAGVGFHLERVGEHRMLAIVFTPATLVGLVRTRTLQMRKELDEIAMKKPPASGGSGSSGAPAAARLHPRRDRQ